MQHSGARSTRNLPRTVRTNRQVRLLLTSPRRVSVCLINRVSAELKVLLLGRYEAVVMRSDGQTVPRRFLSPCLFSPQCISSSRLPPQSLRNSNTPVPDPRRLYSTQVQFLGPIFPRIRNEVSLTIRLSFTTNNEPFPSHVNVPLIHLMLGPPRIQIIPQRPRRKS